MDKKSKSLLIFAIVITFLSIGITFYRTIINNDFEVVNWEEEVPEQTDIFE